MSSTAIEYLVGFGICAVLGGVVAYFFWRYADFRRAFITYWDPKNIAHRMDVWVSRVRDQTDQEPDWDVERRIAKRRAEDARDTDSERDS